MKELLIFPYSGTAVEALDCLGSEWDCIGFISDNTEYIGKTEYGIKIFDRSAIDEFKHAQLLAVHGSPMSYQQREEILVRLNVDSNRYATVIHPNASIGKCVKLGKNVLIMAGVVITSNAVIKDHVVILPNSVVHHDCTVGELTLIAANVTIAGNVIVGRNCYIGASSSIRNNVSLDAKTLVGIGSNVISSFGENQQLIGNPARPR